MKKIKSILVIYLILLLSLQINIFAYEMEEETDYIWLQEEILNTFSNSTNEPEVDSRYAAVFDRTSKKLLYGKNENTKVPMASTTKIMTAIVLIESMKEKDLSFESEIEVCKEAASIGGSRLGLKTGDKVTINDLLYGLMLCSRK